MTACAWCGALLGHRRSDARYCSGACRAAASRHRDPDSNPPCGSESSTPDAERSAQRRTQARSTPAEQAAADSQNPSHGHPCAYEHHRPLDWRLPGGRWVCGICHPPGLGDQVIQWRETSAEVRAFVLALLLAFPGSTVES